MWAIVHFTKNRYYQNISVSSLDDVEIDLKKNHSFKKSYAFYSSLPVREWDSSVAVSSNSVATSSNSSISESTSVSSWLPPWLLSSPKDSVVTDSS